MGWRFRDRRKMSCVAMLVCIVQIVPVGFSICEMRRGSVRASVVKTSLIMYLC